ncbi:hypothetical protein ACFQX6_01770 [Streptosporangium lutulentum]
MDEQAASILDRMPATVDMDLVYARSEGNPLFVEALLSEGGEGAALPDSLRDLLLASVERLPEETQELLRVASAGEPGSSTRCSPRSPESTTTPSPGRCARRWRATCSWSTARATPSGTP